MSNQPIYLSGLIFALLALIHLGRVLCPFQITIGSYIVPESASYAGFVVFGMLSMFLFRSRHRRFLEE